MIWMRDLARANPRFFNKLRSRPEYNRRSTSPRSRASVLNCLGKMR